ncbi:hypothetical protein GCM10018783_02550 [Streptomyces griseosporeus]|nr:hypothetical protein GCM10018783_02550 [Streptomyces griseosporeus]
MRGAVGWGSRRSVGFGAFRYPIFRTARGRKEQDPAGEEADGGQGMTAVDVPATDRFDWLAQVVSQGGLPHLGAAQVSRFSYSRAARGAFRRAPPR